MSPVWGASRIGMLMLTESAGLNAFNALPTHAGDWDISPCAETCSKVATHKDGSRIAIVAGRQIATAEGLEVLALGLTRSPADGQNLGDTLKEIHAADALAVLPWGVGKWAGARGELIDRVISENVNARDCFLSDSAVRPKAMPRPVRFTRAETLGWRVLAGTDPLPLPGEATKPGRFGFLAKGPLDFDSPFYGLAGWLRQVEHSPKIYGQLETLPRFVVQQLHMQFRKRFS
ncbi:MAG: hypothetical protein AAGF50_10515 [Pseudomonadota bacterium]